MVVIPVGPSKVTAAVWGPYEEYIIGGLENGELCHFDVKVKSDFHFSISIFTQCIVPGMIFLSLQ